MPINDIHSARVFARLTVIFWLSERVHLSRTVIDIERTFADDPPDGYGLTMGSYMSMCDDLTSTINAASGRSVVLGAAWRLARLRGKVSDFIGDLARIILESVKTPDLLTAESWAASPE